MTKRQVLPPVDHVLTVVPLPDSEIRFRLLVDSVKDFAILMLDPNGIVTTWNSGAERIKGYRVDEIIGRHFSVFYPPEVRAQGQPQRKLETAVAEGRFEETALCVRRNGTMFWADVITPIFRQGGKAAWVRQGHAGRHQ